MRIHHTLAISMLALASLCFFGGCGHTGGGPRVTLEPGGVYTDPVVAEADLDIRRATETIREFVAWGKTTPWQNVRELAVRVEANEPEWSRAAYAARDAYYLAAKAWREAMAAVPPGEPPPDETPEQAAARIEKENRRRTLLGTIAVLTNITDQIHAARANVPPGPQQ